MDLLNVKIQIINVLDRQTPNIFMISLRKHHQKLMVVILNGVSTQNVQQVVVREQNIVNVLVIIHFHKMEVMDVKPLVKAPNQAHAKSKTVQLMENTERGLLTVLVAKHAAVEVKKALENVTVQHQDSVETDALVLQNNLKLATLKIAQLMENMVLGLLTVLVAKHAAVEVKKELENVTVQLQDSVETDALVLQKNLKPAGLKIAQ